MQFLVNFTDMSQFFNEEDGDAFKLASKMEFCVWNFVFVKRISYKQENQLFMFCQMISQVADPVCGLRTDP